MLILVCRRTYSSQETCLVLQGRVTVTPDGGAPVEIKAGDMAIFPAGMKCTWEVRFGCAFVVFKLHPPNVGIITIRLLQSCLQRTRTLPTERNKVHIDIGTILDWQVHEYIEKHYNFG